MRAILLGMLIALPTLGAMSAATAEGSGIAGTWTWTYPAVSTGNPSSDQPGLWQQAEPATLNLGPTGHWTVDMPSALIGCNDGKPMYSPKAQQGALLQTFPDGSCVLYYVSNGYYVPTWRVGVTAAGAQAGPFQGYGRFQ